MTNWTDGYGPAKYIITHNIIHVLCKVNHSAVTCIRGYKHSHSLGVHQYTILYLFEYQINGTPNIDIHKVNVGLRIDKLCTARHRVNVSTTHLHTKYVL